MTGISAPCPDSDITSPIAHPSGIRNQTPHSSFLKPESSASRPDSTPPAETYASAFASTRLIPGPKHP